MTLRQTLAYAVLQARGLAFAHMCRRQWPAGITLRSPQRCRKSHTQSPCGGRYSHRRGFLSPVAGTLSPAYFTRVYSQVTEPRGTVRQSQCSLAALGLGGLWVSRGVVYVPCRCWPGRPVLAATAVCRGSANTSQGRCQTASAFVFKHLVFWHCDCILTFFVSRSDKKWLCA
jgi:hypothetical protein